MKLFAMSDVARITGIDETRIHYAHRSAKIPEPSYFVGRRRIYTDDDVRLVAEFFGVAVKIEDNDELDGEQRPSWK